VSRPCSVTDRELLIEGNNLVKQSISQLLRIPHEARIWNGIDCVKKQLARYGHPCENTIGTADLQLGGILRVRHCEGKRRGVCAFWGVGQDAKVHEKPDLTDDRAL